MKKILLDTNAYSGFLRDDEKVYDMLAGADTVYMSIIVLAELYTGFKGGSKETWNKDLLQKFLKKPTVEIIDASAETAEIFAHVKSTLKRSGSPIPINDVWIASHALETGSLLVTYDEHFKKVPGVRLWDYVV
ncbi:MAG: type II toxin-antitoxin system VapC family toxin [bacterium]|nr:type II toxin-antitoxin system VapC family toxin [bacterium]